MLESCYVWSADAKYPLNWSIWVKFSGAANSCVIIIFLNIQKWRFAQNDVLYKGIFSSTTVGKDKCCTSMKSWGLHLSKNIRILCVPISCGFLELPIVNHLSTIIWNWQWNKLPRTNICIQQKSFPTSSPTMFSLIKKLNKKMFTFVYGVLISWKWHV